jgi:hypothetical protein
MAKTLRTENTPLGRARTALDRVTAEVNSALDRLDRALLPS